MGRAKKCVSEQTSDTWKKQKMFVSREHKTTMIAFFSKEKERERERKEGEREKGGRERERRERGGGREERKQRKRELCRTLLLSFIYICETNTYTGHTSPTLSSLHACCRTRLEATVARSWWPVSLLRTWTSSRQ